ncbi:unnamed protein product [Diamesa serratosioi]
MGKAAKKTRWRTFSFNSSKENNNFTTTSNNYYNRERSQRFISKAPNSYYNKSNNNKDYRSGTSIGSNVKDKRLETKSNGEVSAESEEKNERVVTPPILFNEDEYTRITTPRQDVLFKKGYLSRMNNNKTATTTTTNTNLTESTTTNSDPDSSVSTLSTATTPSTIEYSAGTKYSSDMMDSMDYPMYYPGCYYDENGVMVFPMYANGYNYYQNASNASSNASPVYLMPYPYSYDYYMPPTASTPPTSPANEEEEETTASTNNSEDKNYINEITNITDSTATLTTTSNTHTKDSENEDTSNIPSDNLSTASGNSTTPAEKTLMPICPNEINGFIYPAGPNYNGYYNNFYYYNGASQLPTRPPKYKSRKRFIRARNSSQQSQNSAETTTDYSDEENAALPFDVTNLVMNTNLNVDVQEFYPRNIIVDNVENGNSTNGSSAKTVTNSYVSDKWEASRKMQDKSQIKDKEEKLKTKEGDNEKTMTGKDVGSKTIKHSSHNGGKSSSKVTKKENIESIKQMEQQNIDLLAISKLQTKPVVELDVEWNVIKKGKRIKIANKNGIIDEAQKEMLKVEKIPIETTKDTPIPEQTQNTDENSKESIVKTKETKVALVNQKAKKSKTKNKKNKKLICGSKLDGFEIIEPDFGAKLNGIQQKKDIYENGIDVSDDDITISEDINEISEEDIAELLKENAASMHLDDDKDAELIDILNDLLADDDNEIIDIIQKKVEEHVNKRQVPILKNEKSLAKVEAPVVDVEAHNKIVGASNFNIEATVPEIHAMKAKTAVVNVSSAKNQENKIKNIEKSIKQVKDSVKPDELKIEPAVYQNGIEEQKMVEVVEEVIEAKKVVPKQNITKERSPIFDYNYMVKENVANLERDFKKNLKLFNGDEDIELKSPIINPLTDFPITNAIQKWLQTKQNESFDSLFHVQNFKKLHLTESDEADEDDYEADEDDEEDTESETSDKPITDDSDYASDIQVKTNTDGANDQAGTSSITSSNSKLNTVTNGKSKNVVKVTKLNANMVKDKLCAIM